MCIRDRLKGGAGVDVYKFTGTGFLGTDTITDSDGQGVIMINDNPPLSGGNQVTGTAVSYTHLNERVTTTTIFPNIKVDYSGWYVYDSKTQELIFKKPHYQYSAAAFLYLPSDSGNKTALFLPTCKNYAHFLKSDDILKKLNLTVVNDKQVLK